jgi:hypothetical protein
MCLVYQAELSLSSVQFASGSSVSHYRGAEVGITELLTAIFPVHTPLLLKQSRFRNPWSQFTKCQWITSSQKVTLTQLVKKIHSVLYESLTFITAFTKVLPMNQCTKWQESSLMLTNYFIKISFNFILQYTRRFFRLIFSHFVFTKKYSILFFIFVSRSPAHPQSTV